MGFTREPFAHNWSQGNYVDGGVLEGRIDWDVLDELTNQSMAVLERVYEEFDTLIVHFSGGLDILCIVHMLDRLGVDAQLVNFRSIEQFPDSVDFIRGIADAFDFELIEMVNEDQDIEWVKENEDEVLWPTFKVKDRLYHDTYRNVAHQYHVDNDVDAYITGRRSEHNHTPKTVIADKEAYDMVNPWPELDEMVSYQVNPINTWNFEYVAAYLDAHSIPVMPGYRFSEVGCEYPWHRAERENVWTEYEKTPEQQWWECRQMTVRYGYTDFWTDHISKHFPRGEELASMYAADTDADLLSYEDGYNHGADAEPVPYPCGPVTQESVVSP